MVESFNHGMRCMRIAMLSLRLLAADPRDAYGWSSVCQHLLFSWFQSRHSLSLSLICVTFYHLWFGEPYNMSREMYESNEKEILLVRLLKVRARQDLSSLSKYYTSI